MRQIFQCCICGYVFEGFGNNPWPFRCGEDDRCCDKCNYEFVIPARIKRMTEKHDGTEQS